MKLGTSGAILVVMGAMGWILACVLGVLSCMVAADNTRGHDVPWQILAALVLGLILSSVPVFVILFAAIRAFQIDSPTDPKSPPILAAHDQPRQAIHWRWIVLLSLGALELLVLTLTVIAASWDDDTLVLSVPLNGAVLAAGVLVACFPYRKRASTALCVVHLIGIAIATFSAAVEIESVVVSGPILAISGIALVCVGTRPRMLRIFFALSTVLFIVVSFLIIAIGEVGPHEADAPLFAAIVAYQILFVPIGLVVLHRAIAEPKPLNRPQFGLKQLLAAMLIFCFAAASARLALSARHDSQIVVAVGLGALIVAAVTAVLAGKGGRPYKSLATRLARFVGSKCAKASGGG